MPIRLDPDPGPALELGLATLLETEGLLHERGGGYSVAWRREALREGVAHAPTGSRVDIVDRAYVAAPWPRRMRGATRA
jgi:hypothetical protein